MRQVTRNRKVVILFHLKLIRLCGDSIVVKRTGLLKLKYQSDNSKIVILYIQLLRLYLTTVTLEFLIFKITNIICLSLVGDMMTYGRYFKH